MNYFDETPAQQIFRESGPFVHLCTSPLESEIFFHSDEERTLALNYIAISIGLCGCSLLAFAIMSNHFHFILAGPADQMTLFWNTFRKLLDNYFTSHGRPGLMKQVEATPTLVSDLRQLRNEIAYVIRNPFVVRPDVRGEAHLADARDAGIAVFDVWVRHGDLIVVDMQRWRDAGGA